MPDQTPDQSPDQSLEQTPPSTALEYDDLLAGIKAGILSEAQAADLIAHTKAQRDYRMAMGRDDEPFEFLNGFSEIFIALGLTLVGIGVHSVLGLTIVMTIGKELSETLPLIPTAAIAVILSRYYALRRRMSLPSFVLASGIFISVFAFIFLTIEQYGSETTNGYFWAFIATAAAMLLYFHFFKLPITMFLFGLSALGAMYSYLGPIEGLWQADRGTFFNLASGSNVAVASLLFGIAMMIGGLYFDMQDRFRLGRHAATGFWLHILASAALVNTLGMTLYHSDSGGAVFLTLLFLVGITLFAIIIDRRSFLSAGIIYFLLFGGLLIGEVTSFAEDPFQGLGYGIFLFSVLITIIGISITLLGTFWTNARNRLMNRLPEFPGKNRLPPYGMKRL